MNEIGPDRRRAQEQERERKILQAAVEELAASDYGSMTIEGVAARAGVNKTTVYRKWETKLELVRAAIISVVEKFKIAPESTGDLRSDLRRIARASLEFVRSSEGQGLIRLRVLRGPVPELADMAKDFRERHLEEFKVIFDGARKRGELAPHVDIELLLDMIWGVVHAREVMNDEGVDDPLIERMIDLLMAAVRPGPVPADAPRKQAQPLKKAAPKAKKKKTARR